MIRDEYTLLPRNTHRVIKTLASCAKDLNGELLLFGGAGLAAFCGKVPKDLDFILSGCEVEKFIRTLQSRDVPIAKYRIIDDYKDPNFGIIYPGKLHRFSLFEIPVDVTSGIRPITHGFQFTVSSTLARERAWGTSFGCRAIPIGYSLAYCLFRSELGGNHDKREIVENTLETCIGTQDTMAVIEGLTVTAQLRSRIRTKRFDVGFRGSRMILQPTR